MSRKVNCGSGAAHRFSDCRLRSCPESGHRRRRREGPERAKTHIALRYLNGFSLRHITLRALNRDMPRQLLVSVILCAAAWCLAGLQAASAVEWFNCDDTYYR